MTREQAREKWEIIKAFGEGKTIQFFGASGDWLDLPENFNLPLEEDLRIKEEPSEKKLKWTDLKEREMKKAKKNKCKYCKGSGMVAMGTDMFGNTIKGFKECPYCKGTGIKE